MAVRILTGEQDFKLQLDLRKERILISNRDRTIIHEMGATSMLIDYMGGLHKIYVKGFIDENNLLVIVNKTYGDW
jgi:hypothetical protein